MAHPGSTTSANAVLPVPYREAGHGHPCQWFSLLAFAKDYYRSIVSLPRPEMIRDIGVLSVLRLAQCQGRIAMTNHSENPTFNHRNKF